MSDQCSRESFLKNVSRHEMEVRHDDGLYRHLRFANPQTCNMYFDLITWPGYLCICGDMGEYVFSRIPDMFGFFRPPGPDLQINIGYWSEKCLAVDRNSPIEGYSAEKFKARVSEWLDEVEASSALRKEVAYSVLSRADDGEHEAVGAATAFEYKGFRFDDFWEVNLCEYSLHFVWCLFAITWGIRQYEASKHEVVTSETPA